MHLNAIDKDSSHLIASNLKFLGKLKQLHLDECELSGDGLLEIMNSLPLTKHLEKISLDYNIFDDKISEELIGIISKIKNLKRTSLKHTGINTSIQENLLSTYPNIIFSF